MVHNMTSFDKTEALQKDLISFSVFASFLLFWKFSLIIKLGWGHIRMQAIIFQWCFCLQNGCAMYPSPCFRENLLGETASYMTLIQRLR